MTAPQAPDWVAVDWGTTHLRAWPMLGDMPLGPRRESDNGMGRLTRDGFAPALDELLADVPGEGPLPVIACGMVGARQGWVEVPYHPVPSTPPGAAEAVRFTSGRFDMRILPGLSQSSPADVMRGEETQIAGFLAGNPDFVGTLCLPGTHNKWVDISGGVVRSFCTFMTGELFELIGTQSVLRHSVRAGGWDEAAFDAALDEAAARPEALAAGLFALRAEGLLANLAPGTARARLSGLLIGAELAAAKSNWQHRPVTVLGDGEVAASYKLALDRLGCAAQVMSGEGVVRAGLTVAWTKLGES
ncbi:MAG: 2-dehydro-3-deoxygalactonokinase [Roseovarius sp.]